MMHLKKKFMLMITGPTGVGKTDLALKLVRQIPAEIVNGDVGQLYTPLSIGTAKPDWRNESVPHHMFDVLDAPRNFTVAEYRRVLIDTMQNIWAKNKIPIIVGGSLFYIKSILFPPQALSAPELTVDQQDLWQLLHSIDPERAAAIEKADEYRIKRALAIWFEHGVKPSEYVPPFDPPADFLLLYLTRDREKLYQRINERVGTMMDQGWIEEVAELKDTAWESFLLKKKLIGYPAILAYLSGPQRQEDKEQLIATIAKKTRNYAKRQGTFWRMLQRVVRQELQKQNTVSDVQELNLTSEDLNLYIKQLLSELTSVFEKQGD